MSSLQDQFTIERFVKTLKGNLTRHVHEAFLSICQMISKRGVGTIDFLQEIGGLVWMGKETVSEGLENVIKRRWPLRLKDFSFQCYRVGIGSIHLVVLLSVFVGLTMALLTGYQLQRFGLVTLVPAIVSVSFTREMGPLFTGIVLAARIGASYTAELGAMTAGGEVDAIEGMGIGALRYLVIPRILAVFFLTSCLSIISILAGIVGAAFISGVIKSFLFGVIIGFIACYKGLSVRGGAVGVGAATTSSVVTSITTVIACDSFCNILIVIFSP